LARCPDRAEDEWPPRESTRPPSLIAAGILRREGARSKGECAVRRDEGLAGGTATLVDEAMLRHGDAPLAVAATGVRRGRMASWLENFPSPHRRATSRRRIPSPERGFPPPDCRDAGPERGFPGSRCDVATSPSGFPRPDYGNPGSECHVPVSENDWVVTGKRRSGLGKEHSGVGMERCGVGKR
jgi:hypothetical protein